MGSSVGREDPFTQDDLRTMVLRLAHEIRNPLATIKSAAQLLEHIQQPEGDTAEYFDGILDEVHRIDRVVRDMQRYARLDTGKGTTVAIGEAVAEAIEALRDDLDARGSEVQVRGGPAAPLVMGHDQLVEALRELISNAVRFSPAGSTTRVCWREHGSSMVRIDVEDEGPGIPADKSQRILRPFFSTSTQATGLGLNIVAKTTRLAGGGLSWENAQGGGARFSITLPRG